jgi:diguanylate cyclase (GGDEF)-like protein
MSVRLKHQSGRWVWMMFAGTVVDRNLEGRATRMAGVAMDVQAQKAMELQLRTAARTDGLTQLPNRSVVLDMVQTAIERGQANQGYFFAVLFMDFDRFKQVNDTLGHGVGDDLLRQIARRLQDSLRPGDSMMHTSDCTQMAARIGGDEFVVLLDDIRGDLEAEIVASRLLDVLAVPYSIGTHKVNSTVSIGIVTSTHAATDADSVLRDADIAMYEAKRTGRAKYVMFDPSMGQRLQASVALENDLRQALDRHELSVVYQPLVDLKTGRVVSMEALMRWRQSDRGVVSPVEFIPVAEACGLIGPMGLFVLQTACSTFASLQTVLGERAPPTVAVNLSRAQLRQPGLAADVLDALRAAGMAAQQLVLEVTESLAAQDELVLATLHEIRALGVALSLDDFGTGYSSLSCLHELPVSFVKIDRSFVIEAQSSEYHRVLIEATIRMAQALKLGTVAEGIETPEQAALMAELGCNKGQGYLYSRPLDAQTLIDWIQARHGGQVPN